MTWRSGVIAGIPPRARPGVAGQRFFLLLGVVSALRQKLATSFAPAVIIFAAFRFPSAVIRLRVEPAIAFALLSHMLMNGFFLVQGFLTSSPYCRRCKEATLGAIAV